MGTRSIRPGAKLVFGAILPWCGLVGLLLYEGGRAAAKWTETKAARLAFSRDGASLLRDYDYLGKKGVFQVAGCEYESGDKEAIVVGAYDRELFIISRNPEREDSLHLSVYVNLKDPLVDIGTKPGEAFPSYIIVYPQTGPDAGLFWSADRDLDGRFEERRRRIAG